jgi:hypothetical protein
MRTKEFLDSIFYIDNGLLHWKIKPSYRIHQGSQIKGFKDKDGYLIVRYKGNAITIHRAIFIMCHGYSPYCIDHIDCDKTNNRIENLREVTRQQNAYNMKLSDKNTSGFKNVTWCKSKLKWVGYVRVNTIKRYVGQFDDINEANMACIAFREANHGEYVRNS